MLYFLINLVITLLFIPPVLLFLLYWFIGLNLAFAGYREKEGFKLRSGIITFLITSALLIGSWILWMYVMGLFK